MLTSMGHVLCAKHCVSSYRKYIPWIPEKLIYCTNISEFPYVQATTVLGSEDIAVN